MEWLSKNWFILVFVFSAGGAFAYQESELQKIEGVVIEQHQQAKEQKKYGEAMIRLQESQKASSKRQEDIQKKLDLLIELQLKAVK